MSDFTDLVDLASERLGGVVMGANDEFFAPKENLIKPATPIFIEDKYTDRGKWMDGWETRRRREDGYDWCIVRLGLPGEVAGVVVDTAHFRGNYPESCSIEICDLAGMPNVDACMAAGWQEILPKSSLQGNSPNSFGIDGAPRATHLRLNIFPDGGVARLRVYGRVVPDWEGLLAAGGLIDLAAVQHGGMVLECSNSFFSSRHNLVLPGEPINMGDGWETERRRGPGHDWVIVGFGRRGTVERVEVNTSHFKGNAPGACSLEIAGDGGDTWRPLLPETPLLAHTRHTFTGELQAAGAGTRVRMNIFPDGGVARLRLWGRPEA